MSQRPTQVPTRSWDEIAQFYAAIDAPWATHIALRRLCEHVAIAPYCSLLFGATSMHTLLVGQHETLEWNTNVLRIAPQEPEQLMFIFYGKELVEPVGFKCAVEDLIAEFERFIRDAKWVSAAD